MVSPYSYRLALSVAGFIRSNAIRQYGNLIIKNDLYQVRMLTNYILMERPLGIIS